ncbi:RNA-binding domain-containing protein [Dendrothele bispora CBS 962.96]|uniref:RNA-binding domain-containing protein n=1 Tax=Dendrothele bispora (strain CBS 962.96) TaxID=1314807 RepID=A0A4S8MCX4_DENBC|nr:RNA-binding domain-containing protein [Dendrothele bispora CBS 962.96]
MNPPREEALQFAKSSRKENRVYVANLSYTVNYQELAEFMSAAGEVLFSEIMSTFAGTSKGCGLVEYKNEEDAQRAIRELTDVSLHGRPVWIRGDRETEPRFGQNHPPTAGTLLNPKSGSLEERLGTHSPVYNTDDDLSVPRAQSQTNQLYVGNIPFQASWQDLKDLFRASTSDALPSGLCPIRADIALGEDGRSRGYGIVSFSTSEEAEKAVKMFSGYEWYGRVIEVREDRYAGLTGFIAKPYTTSDRHRRGGYRGSYRGGLRGGRGFQV